MRSEWQKIIGFVRSDLENYEIDYTDPEYFDVLAAKTIVNEVVGHKGILLMGAKGCGKTKRMRFFCDMMYDYVSKDFQMIDATSFGLKYVEYRASDAKMKEFCEGDLWNDIIIDDLGTEETSYNAFGNVCDVMSNLVIPFRYNMFPRYRTCFTTNLTEKELKERYGERCFSRLNEMCVFITMHGKDRRMEND